MGEDFRMAKYIYWQSDDCKTYIVRQNEGLFENYIKGKGWIENPDRFDIISGIDPYYTSISEEQVLKIIDEYEKSGK
jgi:hypothetical protein